MKKTDKTMERRSGISLWRQIADQIRRDIGQNRLGANGRLPPETALAAHFGVNRHTLRSAIAALVEEGVLRAEQGRGTFVERRRRLTYPIGVRTRFSEGLRDQARDRRGHLLDHRLEAADQRTAEALALAPDARVIRMDTVSEADGRPVSRATSWFDADRFAGFAEAYRELGSITLAFQRYGVADYFRASTLVSARHADDGDLDDLRLSAGAIVLVAVAVNIDTEGRPIQFAETRFAADRVELSVTA
ncbi:MULTISPECIES: phosphonate metabolism transcriptional regulator PhnF [Nitratireductor]|uniref:phosphonate metabolism transcriptional regulator PhnF n=1 Tax=Nitratireductor TaxID=245876 RepID=UPI000D0D601D|nr:MULTISPECIES: phosphonate metabolism transcriptional regulator PhnF [Nitratireductor]PSM19327.1 phosphonate metabolism transcriptional regulator PhnF [Nitratireductor sp. StC3]